MVHSANSIESNFIARCAFQIGYWELKLLVHLYIHFKDSSAMVLYLLLFKHSWRISCWKKFFLEYFTKYVEAFTNINFITANGKIECFWKKSSSLKPLIISTLTVQSLPIPIIRVFKHEKNSTHFSPLSFSKLPLQSRRTRDTLELVTSFNPNPNSRHSNSSMHLFVAIPHV